MKRISKVAILVTFGLVSLPRISRAVNDYSDPNSMVALALYNEFQSAKIVPTVYRQDLPYESITSIENLLERKQNYLNTLTNKISLSDEERQKYLTHITDNIPSAHPLIVEIANLLTQHAKSDLEKVLRIHDFVVWRMTHSASFDNPKDKKVLMTPKGRLNHCIDEHSKSGYKPMPPTQCTLSVPAIDVGASYTLGYLLTGLHNCWGYSQIFAAIVRAAGFPTQVVHTNPGHGSAHIWNRIFINGLWLVVDTTYDDFFDDGQYEEASTMRIDHTFFLLEDGDAGKIDSEIRTNFWIE